MSDAPTPIIEAGQRLDRHHPADQTGSLSSCSKCTFLVQRVSATRLVHLPTAESVSRVRKFLTTHGDWPHEFERDVHAGIVAAAAAKGGFPVSLDEVVEAIRPGWTKQDFGGVPDSFTANVAHAIGADGRWGRLRIIESETGHHAVLEVVLNASDL